MANEGLKGWRQIRAERSSGSKAPWYHRHSRLQIPEYSLNVGWSKDFFWLTLACGTHRVVIDHYSKRGAAYDTGGSR